MSTARCPFCVEVSANVELQRLHIDHHISQLRDAVAYGNVAARIENKGIVIENGEGVIMNIASEDIVEFLELIIETYSD
ncbi:MAG: hypothetical protein ACR2P5_03270 [Gammaproteobacteria bacterium]